LLVIFDHLLIVSSVFGHLVNVILQIDQATGLFLDAFGCGFILNQKITLGFLFLEDQF
jgi:hypothetical protein